MSAKIRSFAWTKWAPSRSTRSDAMGTSQVHQATFSKNNNVISICQSVSVHLWLNFHLLFGICVQPGNIDFDVKVTNIADDAVVLHLCKVIPSDNVTASGGGDKDHFRVVFFFEKFSSLSKERPSYSLLCSLFHGCHLMTSEAMQTNTCTANPFCPEEHISMKQVVSCELEKRGVLTMCEGSWCQCGEHTGNTSCFSVRKMGKHWIGNNTGEQTGKNPKKELRFLFIFAPEVQTVGPAHPSIAACKALMGSISVMRTLAPKLRRACAQPFPTSP